MSKPKYISRLTASLISLGAVLASSPADAEGWISTFNLDICQPDPANSACIAYGQWGAGNTCSTTLNVECPLPTFYKNNFPWVSWINLYAYDRSVAGNVKCWFYQMDQNGNIQGSYLLQTGGWQTAIQTAQATDQHLINTYARMRCEIPPYDANNGYSHLTSLQFAQYDL